MDKAGLSTPEPSEIDKLTQALNFTYVDIPDLVDGEHSDL